MFRFTKVSYYMVNLTDTEEAAQIMRGQNRMSYSARVIGMTWLNLQEN